LTPICENILSPFFAKSSKILLIDIIKAYQLELNILAKAGEKAVLDVRDRQNPKDVFKEFQSSLNVRSAAKKLPTKNPDSWEKRVDFFFIFFYFFLFFSFFNHILF